MVACLKLASEQLAQRSHYHFGMRAAVAVLKTAQHLFLCSAGKEAERPLPCTNDWQRQQEAKRHEAMTLCRALRITTTPKLHPTDQVVFEEILKDVFDEGDLSAAEPHQALKPFLVQAAKQLLVEPSENFLTKALQASCRAHSRNKGTGGW